MYGGSLEHIQRQALHCGQMEFTEPVTNENLKITIPISSDILNLFK
jgi:23S rRNA pseudouridine1911/1915/1917 synthase